MTDADRVEEALRGIKHEETREACRSWYRSFMTLRVSRFDEAGKGRHIERSSGDDFITD